MRNIILLTLTIGCGVGTAWTDGRSHASDTVYLIDGSGSGGSGNTLNPYPGLGTNGLTGESCVHPYSGWQGDSHSAGYPIGYGGAAPHPYAIPATPLSPDEYGEGDSMSPLLPADQSSELYLSRIPSGKRTGVFQRLNANGLWAPQAGGRKGLGLTQFDVSASFAVPMLKPESPLVLTPMFQGWFFDPKGSSSEEYYTTGLSVRWIRPIVKNKFTLDLGATPMYSGTFHGKARKAMRYPVHAAGIWDCNPRLKVIFGLIYLDRNDDYDWLPMAGLVWTPHDDLSVELVAPRMRVARRVRWFGSAAGDDRSDWIYGAFELGGGSWAEHEADEKWTINYRDLRLLLGYERRTAFGLTIGFEVGYMFERKLEYKLDSDYERARSRWHPADSVFVRVRTSF